MNRMTEEVIYADIKTVKTVRPPFLQRHGSHHQGIFLKVGCIMIILLLAVVIVLSVSVSSRSSDAQKSCPSMDWKGYGGKCYWVAESKKSWNESKNDCATKNSHLIVIRDFIDMSFLSLYLNTSSSYWIGLSAPLSEKSWSWVDNSSFDPALFKMKFEKLHTKHVNCAVMSGVKIAKKNCEKTYQWICQL